MKTIIRDCLWRGLPEDSCSDQDIVMYENEIYNYYYIRDRAAQGADSSESKRR